jgi:hypothetical protein
VPLRSLPADSVTLLRAALRTERRPANEPRLQWQIWYSEKQRPDARNQGRTGPYQPMLKRRL